MKINSFAINERKKLGYFFIFFIAIAISSFVVFAAAPTTPSIVSPANNTIFFNDVVLNCSGSTDADSDPIYYQFFINPPQNYTTTGTGGSVTVGNSSDYEWEITISDSSPPADIYRTVTFQGIVNTDNMTFLLSQYASGGGAGIRFNITMDGNLLYSVSRGAGTFSDYYISNDTSSYNDGNLHNLTFEFGATSIPLDSGWAKFWFNESMLVMVQNLTTNTHTWHGGGGGDFYDWSCRACDDNNDCSAFTTIRDLTMVGFNNCTSGNIALNFTLFDEEHRTDIINGDMSFSLLLNGGDSYTYNLEATGRNNTMFCLSPADHSVNLSGVVQYTPTNSSKYTYPREYYFNRAEITGGSQTDINLYSLEDALATGCQFRITEDGVTAVPGYYIQLQRWHPGEGLFDLVAMGNTSTSGTYTIYLRQTDAFYRVFVYDGNNNLAKTIDTTQIQSCPYQILVGGTSGVGYGDAENWFNFDNININMYFNSTTNNTRLIWSDSTGYATQMCIRIDKFQTQGSGYSLYNYTCLSSASGTIYQHINESGFYIAKAIAYHDSDWRLLDSITIELTSTVSDLIGVSGVFYALLLIGLLLFVGLYSPVVSISLGIVGLIFSKMMGLLTVGWGAFIGIIVVGVILIFKQRGK